MSRFAWTCKTISPSRRLVHHAALGSSGVPDQGREAPPRVRVTSKLTDLQTVWDPLLFCIFIYFLITTSSSVTSDRTLEHLGARCSAFALGPADPMRMTMMMMVMPPSGCGDRTIMGRFAKV